MYDFVGTTAVMETGDSAIFGLCFSHIQCGCKQCFT